MSFGKNLQYLRRLYRNLTQEGLSEKLNVSRQTVSKWETDDAMPEMDKALELCKIFNCTLDNLFRDEMSVLDEKYSNLRIEMVKGFRYIAHTVLSTTPEDDALDRVFKYAKEWEIENPKVIGWDFPFLSPEQINITTCTVTQPPLFCQKESYLKTKSWKSVSRATIITRQSTLSVLLKILLLQFPVLTEL